MTSDYVPLIVYRGLPFEITGIIHDDDPPTIVSDLTGFTFSGACGPMSGDGPNYPMDVDVIGDPTAGQLSIRIEAEHTAELSGTFYQYNIIATDPDGVPRPLLKGPLQVETIIPAP